MLAKDLIRRLEELVEKHGNIQVRYYNDGNESDVSRVEAYDEHGYDACAPDNVVEFFIH